MKFSRHFGKTAQGFIFYGPPCRPNDATVTLCVCALCSQSTPESWAQFTHDNIVRAEHERAASVQLRTLIDNVVSDTSRDMKEQADAVDSAFQKRICEVENAKAALDDNLRKVDA